MLQSGFNCPCCADVMRGLSVASSGITLHFQRKVPRHLFWDDPSDPDGCNSTAKQAASCAAGYLATPAAPFLVGGHSGQAPGLAQLAALHQAITLQVFLVIHLFLSAGPTLFHFVHGDAEGDRWSLLPLGGDRLSDGLGTQFLLVFDARPLASASDTASFRQMLPQCSKPRSAAS